MAYRRTNFTKSCLTKVYLFISFAKGNKLLSILIGDFGLWIEKDNGPHKVFRIGICIQKSIY